MGSSHNSIQLLIDAESTRRVQDENSLIFMDNPNVNHLQRLKFRSFAYTLAAESNKNQTTLSREKSPKLS